MDNEMKIRYAARTVIYDNNDKKIAVLEVKNGVYHKIPGGGVENNETIKDAAVREALEEGACDVQLIAKIGEFEFAIPEPSNVINHSTCFLAKKIKDHTSTSFTEEETSDNFKLLWLTIDEAIELFKNVKSKVSLELKMNNRDLGFIIAAKEYLENKNIN